MKELFALLDRIESLIDEKREKEKLRKAEDIMNSRADFPPIRFLYPYEFTPYSIAEIHEEKWKMMFNELLPYYQSLLVDDDMLPMIRANYGVGTFVSQFGYQQKIVGNTMPWVSHGTLDECVEAMKNRDEALLDKVLETQEFYREILRRYEKCSKWIRLYHCDLQGPLDNLHLMLGNDLYYMMYDDEDTLKKLLEQISARYVETLKKVRSNIDDIYDDNTIYHWQSLYRGKAVLRNDTAVTISKEMYEKFSLPYEEWISSQIGGASFHYCGKEISYFDSMLKIKGFGTLNIGAVPSMRYNTLFLSDVLGKLRENSSSLNWIELQKADVKQEIAELKKFGNFSVVVTVSNVNEAKKLKEEIAG